MGGSVTEGLLAITIWPAALYAVLVLGLAAIGLFVFRAVPRNVALVYALDDAPDVRKVEVDVLRGDGALRHAEFRFPSGAPAQVEHDVKLTDGEYRVEVRVYRASGPPGREILPFTVTESGPVVLAVHDRPARAH